jgi:hypothetical protein
MTPLTPADKRNVAALFLELKSAIHRGDPNIAEKYAAFRAVYDGGSRRYVDSFEKAHDKSLWVGQLELYLSEEIEPQFWNPDQLSDAAASPRD